MIVPNFSSALATNDVFFLFFWKRNPSKIEGNIIHQQKSINWTIFSSSNELCESSSLTPANWISDLWRNFNDLQEKQKKKCFDWNLDFNWFRKCSHRSSLPQQKKLFSSNEKKEGFGNVTPRNIRHKELTPDFRFWKKHIKPRYRLSYPVSFSSYVWNLKLYVPVK